MFDGIIFDLDGTLWDETHVTAEAWERVLQDHPEAVPVFPIDSDAVGKTMGLTCEEIAVMLFPCLPFDEAMSLMDESCKYENMWLPECGGILYCGIEALLEKLKRDGRRLFIVSNCQDGYIEAFLKAHRFEDVFDDFECSGRTGLSKAENIRLIAERNRLESPVYVGDTSGDKDGARGAGIPFIYARYGFGEKYGRGKTDDYDAVIDSPEELIGLV